MAASSQPVASQWWNSVATRERVGPLPPRIDHDDPRAGTAASATKVPSARESQGIRDHDAFGEGRPGADDGIGGGDGPHRAAP